MQNINKFTEVYIFVPSITIRRKLPYMESRVKEIDYLKCIFITLMIIFHLVYIGDKYPYAKQIVYTFHMSAFLIISGYLANNRKDVWGIERSGFFNGREKWAKGFENQRV